MYVLPVFILFILPFLLCFRSINYVAAGSNPFRMSQIEPSYIEAYDHICIAQSTQGYSKRAGLNLEEQVINYMHQLFAHKMHLSVL
jgi:hypothetical protein